MNPYLLLKQYFLRILQYLKFILYKFYLNYWNRKDLYQMSQELVVFFLLINLIIFFSGDNFHYRAFFEQIQLQITYQLLIFSSKFLKFYYFTSIFILAVATIFIALVIFEIERTDLILIDNYLRLAPKKYLGIKFNMILIIFLLYILNL